MFMTINMSVLALIQREKKLAPAVPQTGARWGSPMLHLSDYVWEPKILMR